MSMIEENQYESNQQEHTKEQEHIQEHEESEQPKENVLAWILKSLPTLTRAEIAKVTCAGVQLLEKGAAAKRISSNPKGVAPPHLAKASAWARHFLAHHSEHGWDAIRVEDKKTKQLIEYAASKEEDGTHVFEDTGKPMTYIIAMKISNTAEMQATDLYREWEESYVSAGGAVVSKASEEEKAAAEAEKKAERERIAAIKKEEAAKAKAEKLEQHKREVAERAEERKRLAAEKKQQKEDEAKAKAEEKRILREAEAMEKKPKVMGIPAEVKAAVTPVVSVAKATKPAKATAALPAATAALPAALPVATAATATKIAAPRPKKAKEEWVPPMEGELKEFIFDGIQYFRDFEGYMWIKHDNELGDFIGKFVNGAIDTTVENPFDDE